MTGVHAIWKIRANDLQRTSTRDQSRQQLSIDALVSDDKPLCRDFNIESGWSGDPLCSSRQKNKPMNPTGTNVPEQ